MEGPTIAASALDLPDGVVLRDGTAVEFVVMRPEDAERLLRFHETLSSETTYLRYFSFHPELRPQELYRFTHVDHRDREAVVAVVAGEIVGVARFDRLETPAEAEVAFVVADSWQGRGLGTLLFERLAQRARRLGIERFIAQTLAHNTRMLSVFHHTGLPVTHRRDAEIIHLVIDLEPRHTFSVPNPTRST